MCTSMPLLDCMRNLWTWPSGYVVSHTPSHTPSLSITITLSLHHTQSPQVDIELAREIAGRPLRNKDMQKRLWLKIAQHVIKKEENIEK